MGLISPGGESLLDFLEWRQVLSTYDGNLRDPHLWPRERPVPMRVAREPIGVPLPSMPGPKTSSGEFQDKDRLTSRWHVGQPCGKASWERLVGKPRGKASRESHRSLDPREGKRDTAATSREESTRACPHPRRGLTPLGRLQRYPKIQVSTGEESSGCHTDCTQDLRPRHRRERNPERPPSNSPGDWPFLRPPERVPEVLVVSREHLSQLEKIQEVLPSRRDEAHFH